MQKSRKDSYWSSLELITWTNISEIRLFMSKNTIKSVFRKMAVSLSWPQWVTSSLAFKADVVFNDSTPFGLFKVGINHSTYLYGFVDCTLTYAYCRDTAIDKQWKMLDGIPWVEKSKPRVVYHRLIDRLLWTIYHRLRPVRLYRL